MTVRRWKWEQGTTTGWAFRWTVWRLQIGGRLMRHAYGPHTSDRWVLQPDFVYDRKPLAPGGVPVSNGDPQ